MLAWSTASCCASTVFVLPPAPLRLPVVEPDAVGVELVRAALPEADGWPAEVVVPPGVELVLLEPPVLPVEDWSAAVRALSSLPTVVMSVATFDCAAVA